MKSPLLEIHHVNAFVEGKQILFDVSCEFEQGKMTVLMGPNGSGKSTLAHLLMGNTKYRLIPDVSNTIRLMKTSILLNGKNITDAPVEKRAKMGLFLSFQSPVAIPGVSVKELLHATYHTHEISRKETLSAYTARIQFHSKKLQIDANLLLRSIHEEFSGGERKKIELLQALVLRPVYAIFDEIDTGVDVDGLQLIAQGIRKLKKDGVGIILITHSERILRYIKTDRVLVMANGRIVKEGSGDLIKKINRTGYTHL